MTFAATGKGRYRRWYTPFPVAPPGRIAVGDQVFATVARMLPLTPAGKKPPAVVPGVAF